MYFHWRIQRALRARSSPPPKTQSGVFPPPPNKRSFGVIFFMSGAFLIQPCALAEVADLQAYTDGWCLAFPKFQNCLLDLKVSPKLDVYASRIDSISTFMCSKKIYFHSTSRHVSFVQFFDAFYHDPLPFMPWMLASWLVLPPPPKKKNDGRVRWCVDILFILYGKVKLCVFNVTVQA